jgi:cyanobactin maturation PatA/PatG family protease
MAQNQNLIAQGENMASDPQAPKMVYVLGKVSYDFGTEQRRDSFAHHAELENPNDPDEVLAYLDKNPSAATSLIWTLSHDTHPLYAIEPTGPFAESTYAKLREFVNEHRQPLSGRQRVERVALPGWIAGEAKLLNHEVVPVIRPETRGMFSWAISDFILQAVGLVPEAEAERKVHGEKVKEIRNFMERIYYDMRNPGREPRERAINYAATNAFKLTEIYTGAITAGTRLDKIEAELNEVCRTGADCWDVKITFFNPSRRLEEARTVYRFTIDVSDVVPFTVGPVRSWSVY